MSHVYPPAFLEGTLPSLTGSGRDVFRDAGAGNRGLTLVSVFFLSLLAAGTSSATVVPYVADLGSAQKFAVLLTGSVGGSNSFSLQGNSEIAGDVGLGSGVSFTASGKSAEVTGDIFTTTALQFSPGSTLADQQVQSPALVNRAIADAISFSQTVAGFTATQTFSTLDSSATILGNGGVNVIDFTGGGLDLGKKEVLTLSGNANDVFYINFLGDAGFSVSGAAQIVLAGGVNPNNIYWNIADGSDVSITGGTVYGTILNINSSDSSQGAGDFTMKNATLYGRIVGGGGESASVINGAVIEMAAVQQAPEANSVAALALLGVATAFSSLVRRWGRRPLNPAFFDDSRSLHSRCGFMFRADG